MRSLTLLVMHLETDKPVGESASKLRGYIGNKFSEHPILHHHAKNGEYIYTYPRVQYKIIEGTPLILGLEEGAEALKEISGDITNLQLGKNTYKIESIQMTQKNTELGACRENHQYQFITPWLALNPTNYKKFKNTNNWKKRKELLNNILIGNILSLSKGLDHVVDRRLHAHTHLDMHKVEYKAIPHIGFTGEFRTNFKLPSLIGLGMGTSQGFGTIKKD